MKKIILILAFGLLAIFGLFAQHFVPAWQNPYQNPYLAMNIYVRAAEVNGVPLNVGDEIGVFDGDLLVGSIVMDKVAILENGVTGIRVSMEGGGVPGSATVGHFIKFKVWVQATNTEYSYPDMSVWFDDNAAGQYITQFATQGSSFINMLQYITPADDSSIPVAGNAFASVPLTFPNSSLSITALGAFNFAGSWMPNYITTAGTLRVIFINHPPIGVGFSGTPPEVSSQFHWYIDSGSVGFTADVDHPVVIRLDTTGLTGFVDYSQLTAYKRDIHGTPFFEPCTTVWNDPYLDVSVTDFSEIILGGPEESTLPVELSSFTASINAQNNVSLNWITQSETGVIGFNVYRAGLDDLELAELVSPLIDATNTSTTQSYVFVDQDLYEPGEYYYWLQNVDLDGSMAFHGPISILFAGTDSNHSPNIGPVDGINQTYPNPFNPNVFISYGLTKAARVDLGIYNLRGQLVSRLVDSVKESGSYRVIWNGCHDSGSACSSGVYIVRMSAGGKSWSSRIMLVK